MEHDGPTISPGSSTGAPISQQATLSVPQPYPSPDSSKSTPAPWVVPSPSKKAPSISLDLGDLCPTAWDPVAQPDTSLDNFDLDFSETAYSGNLQPDIGGHFGAGQSIAKDMSSGGVFQNETDPNVTLQRPPLNDYATPEVSSSLLHPHRREQVAINYAISSLHYHRRKHRPLTTLPPETKEKPRSI